MTERLGRTERELVALGAALGSNCVPCIEYHVPEARRAGLSDRQIGEALRLADQVRRTPARKVFERAFSLLEEPASPPVGESSETGRRGGTGDATPAATGPTPDVDDAASAAPSSGSCCG